MSWSATGGGVPTRVVDGKALLDTDLWSLPGSLRTPRRSDVDRTRPLRFARFHLGLIQGEDGKPIAPASPGGNEEPCGARRDTADGVQGFRRHVDAAANHPGGSTSSSTRGDWAGQHSRLLMVPGKDFAITLVTDGDGGRAMGTRLFSNNEMSAALARGCTTHRRCRRFSAAQSQLAPLHGQACTFTSGRVRAGRRLRSRVRSGPYQGGLRTLNPDGTPEDTSTLALYQDKLGRPGGRQGHGRRRWAPTSSSPRTATWSGIARVAEMTAKAHRAEASLTPPLPTGGGASSASADLLALALPRLAQASVSPGRPVWGRGWPRWPRGWRACTPRCSRRRRRRWRSASRAPPERTCEAGPVTERSLVKTFGPRGTV